MPCRPIQHVLLCNLSYVSLPSPRRCRQSSPCLSATASTMASSSDIIVLTVGLVLAALYLFRDQLFSASKPKTTPITAPKGNVGGGNPRDFVAKMKESVRRCRLSHSLRR